MNPTPEQSRYAATIGSLGGIKRKERLTQEQRSAIARLGGRARWHPLEAQAEREKAQEISQQINQLIQQAFKNGKQLPLV
jgi:SAM-dependent MidA family methyltransferase